MDTFLAFLKKPIVKRILLLAVMVLILYLTRSMITLFLLTFVFTYLANAAQKFIYRHIHRFIPVKRSFIVLFIYIVVIALIVLVLCIYIPKIITQTVDITNLITKSVTDLLAQKTTGTPLLDSALDQVRKIDVQKYVENGGKFVISLLTNFGALGVNLFLAIILSLFYMLQKSRIYFFIGKFRQSKLSWLYDDLKYFGIKFTNTFGKVLQTQIVISFINSILSIIMLYFMGFPSVLGLGVMIFLLGMVPVAGVFISLIPLCIIAYSIGGWQHILYILIMIVILHAIEAYILNPKLMSEKTNLPIFVTFLVLTVSEHFFGIWGLLVGIPVFIFLLDILDVNIAETKARIGSGSSGAAQAPKQKHRLFAHKSKDGSGE